MTDHCRHDDTISSLANAVSVLRSRVDVSDNDKQYTNDAVSKIESAIVGLASKIDSHTTQSINNKNDLITLINSNKAEIDLKIEKEIREKKWFDFKALISTAIAVCGVVGWVISIYIANIINPLDDRVSSISCVINKEHPEFKDLIKCKT